MIYYLSLLIIVIDDNQRFKDSNVTSAPIKIPVSTVDVTWRSSFSDNKDLLNISIIKLQCGVLIIMTSKIIVIPDIRHDFFKQQKSTKSDSMQKVLSFSKKNMENIENIYYINFFSGWIFL